jgi:hypothetical protein
MPRKKKKASEGLFAQLGGVNTAIYKPLTTDKLVNSLEGFFGKVPESRSNRQLVLQTGSAGMEMFNEIMKKDAERKALLSKLDELHYSDQITRKEYSTVRTHLEQDDENYEFGKKLLDAVVQKLSC